MTTLAAINGWKQTNLHWKIALSFLLLLPWALVVSVVVMEVCVATIGVMFLWESYVNRDWSWTRKPFFCVALIAWIWLMVASLFAIKPSESFYLALPWIRYALLIVALRHWLLKTRGTMMALVKSSVLVMLLCSVDMLWQLKTGLSLTGHAMDSNLRLTGPFHGPKVGIYLAKLFVPVLGASLFLYLSERQGQGYMPPILRAIFPFGAVGIAALIFLSGGRVAFGTTAIATAIMLLVVAMSMKNVRKQILSLILLACAVFGVLVATQDTAKLIVDRTALQMSGYFSSTHWIVLKAGWQVGEDHWLTGVGMHGFREITAEKYKSAASSEFFPERYLHTHNTYTEWFAEAGLVGLICSLALVFLLLREAICMLYKTEGLARLMPAAMLGACFMNFFPFMTTMSYFNNWAGVLTWFSIGFVYSLPALLVEQGKDNDSVSAS